MLDHSIQRTARMRTRPFCAKVLPLEGIACHLLRSSRSDMAKTVYEIRRENLTRLLAEPGAKTELAIRLGVTQARITHLLKPSGKGARPIHEDQARQIETILGLSPYGLDHEPGAQPARAGNDLPLLEDAVRAVVATAAQMRATLVADKAAAIVSMVYEHSRAAGKIDPAFVQQLVKLMR